MRPAAWLLRVRSAVRDSHGPRRHWRSAEATPAELTAWEEGRRGPAPTTGRGFRGRRNARLGWCHEAIATPRRRYANRERQPAPVPRTPALGDRTTRCRGRRGRQAPCAPRLEAVRADHQSQGTPAYPGMTPHHQVTRPCCRPHESQLWLSSCLSPLAQHHWDRLLVFHSAEFFHF